MAYYPVSFAFVAFLIYPFIHCKIFRALTLFLINIWCCCFFFLVQILFFVFPFQQFFFFGRVGHRQRQLNAQCITSYLNCNIIIRFNFWGCDIAAAANNNTSFCCNIHCALSTPDERQILCCLHTYAHTQ